MVFISGVAGINKWIRQGQNQNAGEIESLKLSIVSLNNIITIQDAQIKNAEDKILELGKIISTVNSQLTSSNQKVSKLETAIKNHKTIITNAHANEDLWQNV